MNFLLTTFSYDISWKGMVYGARVVFNTLHNAFHRSDLAMLTDRFPKVRARAPLRLGLAGGGTDVSPYCDRHGGNVLNATIDRYAFATILPREDGRLAFESDDTGVEEIYPLDAPLAESRLPLHRGVYERMIREYNDGIRVPMTIRTTVDAPMGSGLGSSSALVVALVSAFREVLDAPLGDYDIAHLAFEIERIDLGFAGGRQDHYAAAFGGINFIEFLPEDRVIVNPLRVRRAIRNEIESSLAMCFSGASRVSAEIIEQQFRGITDSKSKTLEAMHTLKADAIEMKRGLLIGDIDRIADVLRSSWAAKRRTASSISTRLIDELVEIGFANGAMAGKVSGAGGGGFVVFLVRPENRFRLIEALNGAGGVASPAKLTDHGCESWRF
jgi:D-glycero-alpha-D-manno-heptose-7-phosphate kinase